MRPPSAIRRGYRVGRRQSVTQPGLWGLWRISVSSTSRYMLLPIPKELSPKSRGEGLIKATGRVYRQDYVVFLRAARDKIAFLREYFDPVRAATALDTPIRPIDESF